MPNKRKSLLGMYTIVIAAFFLTGFLLLVVFGAVSYRSTVFRQDDNNRCRELLSYLVVSARSGKVSADGDVLIIADGDTGYAMEIYAYEGKLLEEYRSLTDNSQLNPARANEIGTTAVFDIEDAADNLYRVTTDAGSILLYKGGPQ